jgi:hypothetical protein
LRAQAGEGGGEAAAQPVLHARRVDDRAAAGSTNWGRKARKKMVSLGLRMLSRKALTVRLRALRRAPPSCTTKAERSRQVAMAR